MKIQRTMTDLTPDELCNLMCGTAEEEGDDVLPENTKEEVREPKADN